MPCWRRRRFRLPRRSRRRRDLFQQFGATRALPATRWATPRRPQNRIRATFVSRSHAGDARANRGPTSLSCLTRLAHDKRLRPRLLRLRPLLKERPMTRPQNDVARAPLVAAQPRHLFRQYRTDVAERFSEKCRGHPTIDNSIRIETHDRITRPGRPGRRPGPRRPRVPRVPAGSAARNAVARAAPSCRAS